MLQLLTWRVVLQSSQAAAEGTTPAAAALVEGAAAWAVYQFVPHSKNWLQRFILSTSFHFIFRPEPSATTFSHPFPRTLRSSPAPAGALSSLSSCKYFYYNILSLLCLFSLQVPGIVCCCCCCFIRFRFISFGLVSLVRFSRFAFAVWIGLAPAASWCRQAGRQCQSFVEHTIQCPAVVKRFILLLIRCKCATPTPATLHNRPSASCCWCHCCLCPAGYDANNVMAAQGTRTLLCIPIQQSCLFFSFSPLFLLSPLPPLPYLLLSALVLNINKHFAEIIEVL